MKVLIADDHALFRDGLGMRLEQTNPNIVILQASSFGQALKILDQEKKIDLVVLDLDMPDMPWEDGLREMRKKAECTRFVVISASEDVRNIRKVLESGICGYIPKRSDPKILNSALQLVLDGGTYIPPALIENNNSLQANVGSGRSKGKTLTNRQAQVLDLVAQGMEDKDFASLSFLQWFVDEQVEEETQSLSLLKKVHLTDEVAAGLMVLDQQMGGRRN